jgi:hypothetical protein
MGTRSLVNSPRLYLTEVKINPDDPVKISKIDSDGPDNYLETMVYSFHDEIALRVKKTCSDEELYRCLMSLAKDVIPDNYIVKDIIMTAATDARNYRTLATSQTAMKDFLKWKPRRIWITSGRKETPILQPLDLEGASFRKH